MLAKLNAKQMFLFQATFLPHCKSSFFRKCEIKRTYYIKTYNTVHISSWRIGNSRAADKNCSVPPERQGYFVTLTYVRLPQLQTQPPQLPPPPPKAIIP